MENQNQNVEKKLLWGKATKLQNGENNNKTDPSKYRKILMEKLFILIHIIKILQWGGL